MQEMSSQLSQEGMRVYTQEVPESQVPRFNSHWMYLLFTEIIFSSLQKQYKHCQLCVLRENLLVHVNCKQWKKSSAIQRPFTLLNELKSTPCLDPRASTHLLQGSRCVNLITKHHIPASKHTFFFVLVVLTMFLLSFQKKYPLSTQVIVWYLDRISK